VQKERINKLIRNPSLATQDDVDMIEKSIEEYPYAQILYILRAKIGFDNDEINKNQLLTTAAIYASNRSILKDVIQNLKYLANIPETVPYQELPLFEMEWPEDDDRPVQPDIKEASDSATIFDEVLKNLQKLKSLREQFLFLEGEEDGDDMKPANQPTKEDIDKSTADKNIDKKPAASKKAKKSERKKKEKPPKKEESLKKIMDEDLELDSKVNEYFIAEITQKHEEPEKVKSQESTEKEIIEKFIEEQPSIGSIGHELEKSQEEIAKDLSEKSTKFGDDLVSENLAVILLKQGKKEKALDIYRKLIWKLPQKKAYFAARIEEIKK
jgi:hypothetical protein